MGICSYQKAGGTSRRAGCAISTLYGKNDQGTVTVATAYRTNTCAVCITSLTTNQPDTKSNPNSYPTTKQHATVSKKIHTRQCYYTVLSLLLCTWLSRLFNSDGQWRIQKFSKGDARQFIIPRFHLSQMHTTIYMPFTRQKASQ